ncbi:hypothetical protein GCM10008942_39530 [Rhizomicrobium electricum]|uniref:Uncharacterized protein n=1 Tax=Rhizomicrobium electricum TaxID=480070 RepID=A0ABP3QE06_9PROT
MLETTWVDTLGLGQGSRWTGKSWGDAILITREGNSALVGLLGFVPGYKPGFTLPYDWLDFLKPADRSTDERRFQSVLQLKGEHSLPSFQWPLMAYISDIENLASANLISEETPDDRFSILDCSLAVTSNPISRGIEGIMPCLKQVGTYNPPFVPIREIPAYQLFRAENFSANGDGV